MDKGVADNKLHPYSNDHDMDWQYQNQLRKQWLEDNPNSEYIGWTSI